MEATKLKEAGTQSCPLDDLALSFYLALTVAFPKVKLRAMAVSTNNDCQPVKRGNSCLYSW